MLVSGEPVSRPGRRVPFELTRISLCIRHPWFLQEQSMSRLVRKCTPRHAARAAAALAAGGFPRTRTTPPAIHYRNQMNAHAFSQVATSSTRAPRGEGVRFPARTIFSRCHGEFPCLISDVPVCPSNHASSRTLEREGEREGEPNAGLGSACVQNPASHRLLSCNATFTTSCHNMSVPRQRRAA